MPHIHHHRTRHARRRSFVWLWRAAGIALALFVVLNAIVYVYYRSRTYPNTSVMQIKVGNQTQKGVAAILATPDAALLPDKVTVQHADRQQTVPLAELGVSQDESKIGAINHSRNWFPLAQIFRKHTLPAPIAIDQQMLTARAQTLKQAFYDAPVDASVTLQDTTFSVVEAQDGFELDIPQLPGKLTEELGAGKTDINVPVQPLQPAVSTQSMQDTAQNLNAQLQTALSYRFGSTTQKPDPKTVASWYVKAGNSYEVSDVALGNYLLQHGRQAAVAPGNVRDVIAKTKSALAERRPSDFTITPYATTRTISYCVAARGVNEAALAGLRSKLVQTLGDIRGWSLEGQVVYKEASTGCSFTVWLAAAAQVPSFGGVCDSTWSCRIGPNVVINYDRWQNASPAWNRNGGTLDEYRDMVINHETGHWIGFGHASCGGAGQKAPVMQQQSINLQGCVFSPWPSASEVASARGKLGL